MPSRDTPRSENGEEEYGDVFPQHLARLQALTLYRQPNLTRRTLRSHQGVFNFTILQCKSRGYGQAHGFFQPPPMVDQSGISEFASPTISQGSQNEEEHLVQTEDGSDEQEATIPSSPDPSLSPADNRSETDATDYEEGDRLRGMDAHDSLPPLSDEDKATWVRGMGGR
ncbi:hypothetical protein H634G_10903 [Metarhizium anisopliae BRIP 53293]|uniref:Uncharacterized protein n=1 Tax=Metarhizium anisopliae BRIP 53293 TaxID=1291518 RepID=A0A0D9NID7_METAN|nr:hypothetical protein H634G_10903 [Metarhizium anisopliae BRIP 53293]KJK86013.1 hypothetical protein H633G_10139 [Metarhizium anisopliae BRIP 53284]